MADGRGRGSGRTAVAFVLASCTALPVGPAWHKLREVDGITVFARGAPDRRLPEFRACCEVAANLWEVVAALADVGRFPRWVQGCVEARALATLGSADYLVYTRAAPPWYAAWLIDDRDVALRTRFVTDRAPAEVRVVLAAEASDLAPEIPGVVRLPRLQGSYLLRRLTATRTRLVLEVDADPGGNLPDWIKRIGVEDYPLQTLAGLREEVVRARHRHASVVARWQRTGFDAQGLANLVAAPDRVR